MMFVVQSEPEANPIVKELLPRLEEVLMTVVFDSTLPFSLS